MVTSYIKKIELVNGTWVIKLRNSQIIKGNENLAESIDKAGGYMWPKPRLSIVVETLAPELEAA